MLVLELLSSHVLVFVLKHTSNWDLMVLNLPILESSKELLDSSFVLSIVLIIEFFDCVVSDSLGFVTESTHTIEDLVLCLLVLEGAKNDHGEAISRSSKVDPTPTEFVIDEIHWEETTNFLIHLLQLVEWRRHSDRFDVILLL